MVPTMNQRELENNSFTVNLRIFRPKLYQKIVHRVRVPLNPQNLEYQNIKDEADPIIIWDLKGL